MKSPIIVNADYIDEEDKANYTELQVLQSNAGFYIGTLYRNTTAEGEFEGFTPGTRDSDGYFATKEAAQLFLDTVIASNATFMLRTHP